MRNRPLVVIALLSSALATAAIQKGSQVRVTLQNGTVVTGTVITETSQGLLIDSGGAKSQLVPYANVANIDDLSAPPPPPPSVEPAPAPAPPATEPPASREKHAERRLVRAGFGGNGGLMMNERGIGLSFGLHGGVTFELSERFSLRIEGAYNYYSAVRFQTHLVLTQAMPTLWFGVYGFGLAAGFGFAVTQQTSTFALGLTASPVRLRFGDRFTHELAVEAGAHVYTGIGLATPLVRVTYTFLF